MKIIIVGAGVSGLSTYLQLRKVLPASSSHTILAYESQQPRESLSSAASNPSPPEAEDLTDSAAVVGNSIGLGPSSLRLLRYIDNRLYNLFKARGYVNHSYTFKRARGHTIAVTSTGDRGSPEEYTISCPREGLRRCLHQIVGKDQIEYRKVTRVDLTGKKPIVEFADGGKEDADLIVGADGVRSIIKKAIFEDDHEDRYAPRYEGFCGVRAFIDAEISDAITKHMSMVFTFGPTGSFGYCSAAPLQQQMIGWWSNWGMLNMPDHNVLEPEEIRRQLRDRHGSWKDPVIQSIIESMETDRIYPIWTTPNLSHWGARGAILLGDAAHTLQATSGQGAAQALEDGVNFSLLLSHFITKADTAGSELTTEKGIELTAKALYEIRNPRVAAIRSGARNIYVTSQRIKNIVVEYLYYCFIYIWTNFPIIGNLIVGSVFQEIDKWAAEYQVRRYLGKEGL